MLDEIYRLAHEGVRLGLRDSGHLNRFVEICRHADANEPEWRCRTDIIRTFDAGYSPARLLTELEYDLGSVEEEIDDE